MSQVEVQLAPVPDDEPLPSPWEGDALITWKDNSRLLRIQEVEKESRTARRYFTIDGGLPADWLKDAITKEIAHELGIRMQALATFDK